MLSIDIPDGLSIYDTALRLVNAGGFVCGGGVRDLYLNEDPKDLDTFVWHADENEWFKALRNSGFRQVRRNFYKNNIAIDIVPTHKLSPLDIIEAFDCDVCKWFMRDVPTPLNEDVRKATENRTATFDYGMDMFGTSPFRVKKLRDNGWEVKIINGNCR